MIWHLFASNRGVSRARRCPIIYQIQVQWPLQPRFPGDLQLPWWRWRKHHLSEWWHLDHKTNLLRMSYILFFLGLSWNNAQVRQMTKCYCCFQGEFVLWFDSNQIYCSCLVRKFGSWHATIISHEKQSEGSSRGCEIPHHICCVDIQRHMLPLWLPMFQQWLHLLQQWLHLFQQWLLQHLHQSHHNMEEQHPMGGCLMKQAAHNELFHLFCCHNALECFLLFVFLVEDYICVRKQNISVCFVASMVSNCFPLHCVFVEDKTSEENLKSGKWEQTFSYCPS